MHIAKDGLYVTAVFCLRVLWDTLYAGWGKSAGDKGLTVTEEQILWIIWILESATVTEVARLLQRDKGTISKSVYSLEQNGLLTRSQSEDRRSYTFRITEKGDKLRHSLRHTKESNSPFGRAFSSLSDTEKSELIALLLKMVSYIEGDDFLSEMLVYLAKITS